MTNPLTSTPIFGTMPEIKNKSYYFPEGPIYLKYGKHYSYGKGFGACHIWKEHQSEIEKIFPDTEDNSWLELTTSYVAKIIQTGSKIYCENVGSCRVSILKSFIGMTVIEHRIDGNNNDIYNVITAYSNRMPHGTEIGKLK